MGVIGLSLLALGIADLIAAPSGAPLSRMRLVSGVLAAGVVWAGVAQALGASPGEVVKGAAAILCLAVVWLGVRLPARWSATRAASVLVGVAAILVGAILADGILPSFSGGVLARLLREHPFQSLRDLSAERLTLVLGCTVFLLASTNAVVRLLLTAVGTEIKQGESTLRGGRVIGPMERVLILGFVLAGEPAAAALVVSAKSLLRFPELRAKADDLQTRSVDALTEYFLVGSLTSWLAALALALLASA